MNIDDYFEVEYWVGVLMKAVNPILGILRRYTLETLWSKLGGHYRNLPPHIEYRYQQSIISGQRLLVLELLVFIALVSTVVDFISFFFDDYTYSYPQNTWFFLVGIIIGLFVCCIFSGGVLVPFLGKFPIYNNSVSIALVFTLFLWSYCYIIVDADAAFSRADLIIKLICVFFWYFPTQVFIFFFVKYLVVMFVYFSFANYPMDFVFLKFCTDVFQFALVLLTNVIMKQNSRQLFLTRYQSIHEMKRMKQVADRKLALLEHVLPKSVVNKLRNKKESGEDEESEEDIDQLINDPHPLEKFEKFIPKFIRNRTCLKKRKNKHKRNFFRPDSKLECENDDDDDDEASSRRKQNGGEEEEEFDFDSRILSGGALSTLSYGDTSWKKLVQSYSAATIVFVKIQDFETIEMILTSSELIKLFDAIYSDFDRILEREGSDESVYRIKTINNLYMFSAGFPTFLRRSLRKAMKVCLKMIHLIQKKKYGRRFGLEKDIEVVFGAACGCVVAGVVGRQPSYDCWSDTVNLASRMCTMNHTPMTIQMTKENFEDFSIQKKKLRIVRDEVLDVKGKEKIACVVLAAKSRNPFLAIQEEIENPGDSPTTIMSHVDSRDDYYTAAEQSSDDEDNTTIANDEDSVFVTPSVSTGTSHSSRSGVEDLVRTLRFGNKEDMDIVELRKYVKKEDTRIYDVESISSRVKEKHLNSLNLYNEKQGTIRWSSVCKIVNFCSCHFYDCKLNFIYFKSLFRRSVFSNRVVTVFFILAFAFLLYFDLLQKHSTHTSYMDVLKDGDGVDEIDRFSVYYIIILRCLFGLPVIILFSSCIFLPCYGTSSIFNTFASVVFIIAFGFTSLGISNHLKEVYSIKEIFMVQLLIYNFGGLHFYFRLMTLFLNLLAFTTMSIIMYGFEDSVTTICCGIFITFTITQSLIFLHLNSILDFYQRGHNHAQRKRAEEEETDCSNLMNSILPEAIIQEILKEQNHHNNNNDAVPISLIMENIKSKFIEETSIMFADAFNFTKYSSVMTPIDLVETLNEFITKFDKLTEKYCLSRIKLIGDCYEVATIPNNRNSPRRMALFAISLLEVVKKIKRLQFRIGIHHGSCVSGIVGRSRITWDLFGKTVLIAEEYESTGKRMKIHCSLEFKKCYAHHRVIKRRPLVNYKNTSSSSRRVPTTTTTTTRTRTTTTTTTTRATAETRDVNYDDVCEVSAPYRFVERKGGDVIIHGEKVKSFWLEPIDTKGYGEGTDLFDFINITSTTSRDDEENELEDFINNYGDGRSHSMTRISSSMSALNNNLVDTSFESIEVMKTPRNDDSDTDTNGTLYYYSGDDGGDDDGRSISTSEEIIQINEKKTKYTNNELYESVISPTTPASYKTSVEMVSPTTSFTSYNNDNDFEFGLSQDGKKEEERELNEEDKIYYDQIMKSFNKKSTTSLMRKKKSEPTISTEPSSLSSKTMKTSSSDEFFKNIMKQVEKPQSVPPRRSQPRIRDPQDEDSLFHQIVSQLKNEKEGNSNNINSNKEEEDKEEGKEEVKEKKEEKYDHEHHVDQQKSEEEEEEGESKSGSNESSCDDNNDNDGSSLSTETETKCDAETPVDVATTVCIETPETPENEETKEEEEKKKKKVSDVEETSGTEQVQIDEKEEEEEEEEDKNVVTFNSLKLENIIEENQKINEEDEENCGEEGVQIVDIISSVSVISCDTEKKEEEEENDSNNNNNNNIELGKEEEQQQSVEGNIIDIGKEQQQEELEQEEVKSSEHDEDDQEDPSIIGFLDKQESVDTIITE